MWVETTASGGGRSELAGEWHCRVEHELPLLSASVWSSCPPVPDALNLQNAPAALYHGMIAPLLPFGMRGVIWYQGESNVEQHRTYRERFTSLIRDYRTRWGMGTLPFLFVQLANYGTGELWPYLREAQAECLSEPATGMAVTLDIGDRDDVHPRNKQEVGRRLARLALTIGYGQALECSGPTLDRVEISGPTVRVRFGHARGLCTTDHATEVTGFALAGADDQYHPAHARLEGDSVLVTSPAVSAPLSVRYAWQDSPDVNLVNAEGLPAAPFRTDRY
jgi:sialate O-acetylesterase